MLIRDVAVAGNHDRSALALVLVHRSIENVVQRLDLALNGAAVRDVDHRILRRREHVAGDDDVGAAEVHDAVAVGDRVGHPEHLDRVAVVKLPAALLKIGVARHACRGAFNSDHPILHVLMRDDRRADARIRELQREERSAHAWIGSGRATSRCRRYTRPESWYSR